MPNLLDIRIQIDIPPSQGSRDLEDRIVSAMERRLRQVGSDIADQVRIDIGGPSPPPGAAGSWPGRVSGALVASIFAGMRGRLEAYVASSSPIGYLLHVGNPGGRMIYPVTRFNSLSWVDWRSGTRVFRKHVRQGALAPRPFLVLTLEKMWGQGLDRWLTRPL